MNAQGNTRMRFQHTDHVPPSLAPCIWLSAPRTPPQLRAAENTTVSPLELVAVHRWPGHSPFLANAFRLS